MYEISDISGEVVATFYRRYDCLKALVFKYEPSAFGYGIRYYLDGSARIWINDPEVFLGRRVFLVNKKDR